MSGDPHLRCPRGHVHGGAQVGDTSRQPPPPEVDSLFDRRSGHDPHRDESVAVGADRSMDQHVPHCDVGWAAGETLNGSVCCLPCPKSGDRPTYHRIRARTAVDKPEPHGFERVKPSQCEEVPPVSGQHFPQGTGAGAGRPRSGFFGHLTAGSVRAWPKDVGVDQSLPGDARLPRRGSSDSERSSWHHGAG